MLDFDVWSGCYNRLCAAKEHARNAEQSRALYDVLKEFPRSCVEQAMFRASREVSGWPKSDKLVELARDERRKLDAPSGICDVCHGDGWVDAPDEQHFNLTYTNYVRRCPQCRPAQKTSAA